jgi:hypothetical protein
MRRLIAIALLLAVVQLVVGAAVGAGLFRKVDLRFNAFLALALIPAFQAGVFMWVTRDPAARTMAAAFAVFGNRLAVAIVLADLLILALTLILAPGMFRLVSGAHALAGAAALFFTAMRRGNQARNRTWVVLTATGLLLYGVSGFWNWLALLPDLFGDSAKVLRWAAAYGPLFIIALAVLLLTARALEPRSLPAAGWMEIAVALLLVGAIVIVSNIFLHPFLTRPWRIVESALAWASVTSMILAAVSASTARTGDAA